VAISALPNDTMKKTYRKYSPAFKTKVVLKALKEHGRRCWQQAAIEDNGSAAALPPRLCVDGRGFEPSGVREEAFIKRSNWTEKSAE
jgi:hypothetical protein